MFFFTNSKSKENVNNKQKVFVFLHSMTMEEEKDAKGDEVKYIKTVSETTESLIVGIQKALEFYYEHFNSANKVTHITMCGGLARLKNLDAVISQKIGIESAPGHVWKNLKNPKPDYMSNVDGYDFVSAIGLALRAINYLER